MLMLFAETGIIKGSSHYPVLPTQTSLRDIRWSSASENPANSDTLNFSNNKSIYSSFPLRKNFNFVHLQNLSDCYGSKHFYFDSDFNP